MPWRDRQAQAGALPDVCLVVKNGSKILIEHLARSIPAAGVG
jgi:hypothetical protein